MSSIPINRLLAPSRAATISLSLRWIASILILASLNEEYHQEGGDVSPSVDDELPGVGETEDGSRSCPDDRYAQRNNKGPCAAGPFRDLIRKPFQRTADPARSPLCHNVVLPPFTIVRSEAGLQGWSSQ